jgi:hypothetical protein
MPGEDVKVHLRNTREHQYLRGFVHVISEGVSSARDLHWHPTRALVSVAHRCDALPAIALFRVRA